MFISVYISWSTYLHIYILYIYIILHIFTFVVRSYQNCIFDCCSEVIGIPQRLSKISIFLTSTIKSFSLLFLPPRNVIKMVFLTCYRKSIWVEIYVGRIQKDFFFFTTGEVILHSYTSKKLIKKRIFQKITIRLFGYNTWLNTGYLIKN